MVEVSFTAEARDDILEIEEFLAQRSVVIADRFVDVVLRRCDQLADYPKLGPARPEVNPEARALLFERWVIFYRVAATGVEITRVVDGSRDLRDLPWSSA